MQIKRFRQSGSKTPGHPEYGHTLGVETTTGPLGQGLTTAVGMALAERMMNARFGDELVDHFTYVIAGDGCLMEGISHEAIDLAGHLKLGKLIVLWDDNGISIDGQTSLSTSMDQLGRFEAAGWDVFRIDGHAHHALIDAIAKARNTKRPSLIACRTTIGYGAPNKAGTEAVHGAPLGAAEIEGARDRLDWFHEPFEIPAGIRSAWEQIADRGRVARENWEDRFEMSANRAAFRQALAGKLPAEFEGKLAEYKRSLVETAPKVATRKASEMALGVINAATDLTVGGSADLTHSNLTLTKDLKSVAPGRYAGRYIHYGIREHAMAAVMNGLALHKGCHSLWRHLPDLRGLCPRRHPALGADGPAGGLCAHPRLHRPRRGRPDPPADRAPRHAQGDAEPQRVPPGGRGGDGGGLGDRAELRAHPLGAGAVAAEPADLPHRCEREPHRARRLSRPQAGGAARHHAARHRFGGRDRAARGGPARQSRRRCRGGLDAVLGIVRAAERGVSPRRARQGAARRHRGRGPARLGPLDRRARPASSAWRASAPRRRRPSSMPSSASPRKRW